MPVMKNEDKILAARLILRRQLYRQTDARPNFSDAALMAMAELKPITLDGCRALPDVTPTQAERFGPGYVAVVREHLLKFHAGEAAPSSDNVREILSSLEQQLIGISRRNRLLYTGKLRSRTGVDLLALTDPQQALSVLNGGGKIRVSATDGSKKSPYGALAELVREINRTARETGSYDLYVGYPYAAGHIKSDPFAFEAPLLLFPMRCTKEDGEFVIGRDNTRSVLYNTNLAVAVNRLSGRMETTEQLALEDAAAFDLGKTLAAYAKTGVRIARAPIDPVPYETCEKYDCELTARGFCVLGKFSLQSTSLQRDFNRIVHRSELPKIIADLVENVGKEDLVAKLEEEGVPDAKVRVREKEIFYINELNASQESVVAAMHDKDCLVVSGPPGTGKSQVITSVIADFAMRGKSVLMVTEKKAALDVVRSRLGVVNDFCLQIDDGEDKIGFYDQITGMFNKIGTEGNAEEDVYSDAIERELDRLRAIEEDVYTVHGGVRIADLYREVKKPDMTDPVIRERWRDVEESVFDRTKLTYPEFTAAGKRFEEAHHVNTMQKWLPVASRRDLSAQVRRDLKASEIGTFIVTARDALKRLQRIALLKGGRRKAELKSLKNALQPALERALDARVTTKVFRQACEELDVLLEIFEDYTRWFDAVTTIDAMSEGERRLNEAVFALAARWNVKPSEAFDRVKRYYVCSLIDDWEMTHRDRLRDMDGYEGILARLREGIRGKTDLTVNRLYDRLAAHFANIRISKRFGDMRRVAESARRMSVTRFLQRFDNELFLGVKIWLLTPEIASSILPLREGMFDLVVFDEASQLYVERAIPALMRGKKVLIVGDNKQLRPSSLGSGRTGLDEDALEEEGVESTALEVESLLDLAEAKYDRVMLEAHYRSDAEELIAFSNYAFYKGKLLISPNLHPVDRPIEVVKVKNGVWERRANLPEAQRVVKLLKAVLSSKGDETVGIITFNANQRDAIERAVDAESLKDRAFGRMADAETSRKKDGEDIGLFIKNIENVQGDERDIVIFSVGYAYDKAGRFSRNFGWLNGAHGENRLNVAITRAKKKIYFVTSMDSAEFSVDDLPGYGPRLLKKYMEYAEAVTSGDVRRVKRILETLGPVSSRTAGRSCDPYADTLEKQFRERGYETKRNVGVGGMTLDLAVTYPNGSVEGYESDIDLYRADPDARSRDFHRRSYLESRGWKIHRIWSHDVYERSVDAD